jgi:hypothetical protein
LRFVAVTFFALGYVVIEGVRALADGQSRTPRSPVAEIVEALEQMASAR